MQLNRLLFGVVSVLASSAPAWGQAQPTETSSAAARPSGGVGSIRGFFFQSNGAPMPGVEVKVLDLGPRPDGPVVSDDEGMFLFEIEAGEHPLEFVLPGGRTFRPERRIPVFGGQETEFVVTFPGVGDPDVDIEVPGAALSGPVEDTGETGVVVGVLRTSEGNKAIADARIFVRGTGVDARSDAQGRFEIELPAGLRELTIIHPDYSTKTVKGIEVPANDSVEVEAKLDKKSAQLATMVITAPRIEGSAISVLEERKASSNVEDVLGADQISKSGDSDAASALSRVTGITVVGGRFVYVRGLGERYSSTLMNSSSLPSPDPERRVVPLDLFPASAISSLVVQKSYSADLPGEFGGGVVEIRTKDIPEDFTLELSLSTGANSFATFREGLTYPGGGSDWLGFGVDYRDLPDPFAAVAEDRRIEPYAPVTGEDGFRPGELERFAEMFDPNFGTTPRTLPPDFGASAEVGGKFELFGLRAGAYVSGTYDNKWRIQDNDFTKWRSSTGGALEPRSSFRILEGENEVSLSGLGSFGVDFDDDNQIRLTLGVFRISSDNASETTGFDEDRGDDVLKSRLTWSERMVSTNQVRGTNLLSKALDLRVDWRYQFALATRDQPNRRSLRYTAELTDGRLALDSDGTERFYSELLDLNHDVGVDVSMPVSLPWGIESKLKSGVALEIKDRAVAARRFSYLRKDFRGTEEAFRTRFLPRDRLFDADVIEPGLVDFQETTRSDDNYTAAQLLVAGYVLGEFALTKDLDVQVGLRVESSKQNVDGEPPPGADRVVFEAAELATVDPLPSITATWRFIEDMQLRAGFARTVNRPSFRELSNAPYIDLARAREYRGNEDLQRADILHGDLRWEWYPSPGESVSVAAFAKLIGSPIENSIDGGANQVARPINTDRANNLGVEFEARKNFGFITAALEDLYVAGNLALISSRVVIGEENQGTLTSAERALQGQSPYVVNLQLGYDNIDWGSSASVIFNVFGRRINDVGVNGIPDIYEESRPELNFVFSQRFGRFKVGLKLKNLLNTDFVLTQTETREGGERLEAERYERGISGSLGLSVDLD